MNETTISDFKPSHVMTHSLNTYRCHECVINPHSGLRGLQNPRKDNIRETDTAASVLWHINWLKCSNSEMQRERVQAGCGDMLDRLDIFLSVLRANTHSFPLLICGDEINLKETHMTFSLSLLSFCLWVCISVISPHINTCLHRHTHTHTHWEQGR